MRFWKSQGKRTNASDCLKERRILAAVQPCQLWVINQQCGLLLELRDLKLALGPPPKAQLVDILIGGPSIQFLALAPTCAPEFVFLQVVTLEPCTTSASTHFLLGMLDGPSLAGFRSKEGQHCLGGKLVSRTSCAFFACARCPRRVRSGKRPLTGSVPSPTTSGILQGSWKPPLWTAPLRRCLTADPQRSSHGSGPRGGAVPHKSLG